MEDKAINKLGYFIWVKLCMHGCIMEKRSQAVIEKTIKKFIEDEK